MYITYCINKFGDIECEIKENGKKRVTTDFETVESGLIYNSGLKYCTVTELKNKVVLTNKSFVVRIEDYDEIMNEVDSQIYDNFQQMIEKTRNKVNLNKIAKMLVVGGMVLTTAAGISEIVRETIENRRTEKATLLQTEWFEPAEIVEIEEPKTYAVSYNNRDNEEYVEDSVVEEPQIEESQIAEQSTSSYPTPVITADNKIYINGVRQTGICRDYTCYTKFFSRWNNGTNQRLVADIWDGQGRPSDRGIATIDGRYLVAMTVTFGQVGDYVDVILEDGTVIPCILADAKSPNDANCNAYGHEKGSHGTSMVEFESIENVQESIDISGWQGLSVSQVQLYPGMSILNPITAEDDLTDYEYSDEAIDIIIDELENELDDELATLLENQDPEPVLIEDELIPEDELTNPEVQEENPEPVRTR